MDNSKSCKVFKLLTFVLYLCGAQIAVASDRGLAWELKSADGTQTAFLVGSVHLANASFYPLNPSIMDAFERAEVLLVEADETLLTPQQQQALISKYALYPEGQSYTDHLPKQVVDQVEVMFESLGVVDPASMFSRYRPGMLGVTLAAVQAQALGYTAEYGLDNYFIEKARYKKTIQEIEGLEFQIKLIADLPVTGELFRDALLDMSDFETEWKGLEQAWKKGDSKRMYELAIGSALRDFPRLNEYYETLFFDRNVGMVAKAEQCMARSICFVLVGAGHLVGQRGMVDLFEAKGFQARQLP